MVIARDNLIRNCLPSNWTEKFEGDDGRIDILGSKTISPLWRPVAMVQWIMLGKNSLQISLVPLQSPPLGSKLSNKITRLFDFNMSSWGLMPGGHNVCKNSCG